MEKINFKKSSMSENIAKQIALWIYSGDYNDYNLPSYEAMKEEKYGMLNPKKAGNYICYLNGNEVVAYYNMKKIENKRILIGIGLKPEYCGKGLGKYFLNDGLNETKNRYPGFIICVEVRSWNMRAIKVYEKIGFVTTNTVVKKDHLANDCEFTLMELI